MSLQPDGTAAREGVRIRHYIVSLRYRNPGKAFRIPTSVELAKMFGVARSTVTLELKALTEDGIIIGKRGVGTFTNPAIEYIFPETEHASPLIGLLCGDGQRFFYEHYAWSMLARTGLELTQRQCNVSYVSGPFNAGEISESFLRTGLSGGVWISPPEWAAEPCERLAEAGIPVVTGEQELPGIPGAGYDFEETGCRGSDGIQGGGRNTGASSGVLMRHTSQGIRQNQGCGSSPRRREINCPASASACASSGWVNRMPRKSGPGRECRLTISLQRPGGIRLSLSVFHARTEL